MAAARNRSRLAARAHATCTHGTEARSKIARLDLALAPDYRRPVDRVDYVATFIAVAEDCRATTGVAPPNKPENPSVAARTYRMIAEHPYDYTSGDVIFTVFADRTGIPEEDRAAARLEFYATPRACLRSSDLGKRYGWGVHADVEGRLACYGVETPKYAELASSATLTLTRAMRSTRKKS
jgi:hypothetical protein